jgi:hypothetical protein
MFTVPYAASSVFVVIVLRFFFLQSIRPLIQAHVAIDADTPFNRHSTAAAAITTTTTTSCYLGTGGCTGQGWEFASTGMF